MSYVCGGYGRVVVRSGTEMVSYMEPYWFGQSKAIGNVCARFRTARKFVRTTALIGDTSRLSRYGRGRVQHAGEHEVRANQNPETRSHPVGGVRRECVNQGVNGLRLPGQVTAFGWAGLNPTMGIGGGGVDGKVIVGAREARLSVLGETATVLTLCMYLAFMGGFSRGYTVNCMMSFP
ncbi:hypothetical protein EDB85DRAFT_901274 [Lactarius pseudohatsudake]|nr:hypothetical protein EDB85DRAFT_901274 [Lactarius pseudohatsudake]